jgi:FkbM family methyltransferase
MTKSDKKIAISMAGHESWKLQKLISAPGSAFSMTQEGLLYSLQGKHLLLTDWNDIFIAVDNFVDFDYGFVLPEADSVLVFDVGANIGDTALVFATMQQVDKVYSFEPLPSIYARMQNNLRFNPDIAFKIKSFNYGLGVKDEAVDISYPSACGYCATVSEKWHDDVEQKTTETMQIRDACPVIAELLHNTLSETRLVLKMDCEGAEFFLIPHLAAHGMLNKFSAVLMEFHRPDPAPLVTVLKQQGFTVFFSGSLVGITGRLYAAKNR